MGVKFGLSTDASAPSLSGTAGALIALLDAILINGYGSYTPTAGWSKAFSGTNLAVYRSTATGATGFYLRVDDTTTTYATVRAYESMSDVNTGTNQIGVDLYWRKSSTADATARPYAFAMDERAFNLAAAWAASVSYASIVTFGDFPSDVAGDGYALVFTGDTVSNASNVYSSNASWAAVSPGSTQAGIYAARSYTGSVGGVALGKWGAIGATNFGLVGFANPNPANSDKYVLPIRLMEVTCFRGVLPGQYNPLHSSTETQWSTQVGVVNGANRTFINVAMQSANQKVWIDITGPWR